MKLASKFLLLASLCLTATPLYSQTQTPATPPCQYSPNGVQAGGPPSCGVVMGFIGGDGKFHRVTASDGLPTTGGGGGGGGAVTIAGGADVTEGTIGDTQATGTVAGYLKSLWTSFFGTPVAIKTDGSGVTQPVSAAALPLPTGAATSANQTTGNSSLSTIATNTTGAATAANQTTGNSSLSTIATNTTGAATAANQSTANSSLATVATNTGVPNADATGSGSITAADVGSTTVTTGQGSSSIITGSPTANSTASIALSGRASVSALLSGTWSATVSFEGSSDGGTTWSLVGAHVRGATAATATATANGEFLFNTAGLTNFRVRATAYSSGTVTATLRGSVASGLTYVVNSINTSASGYSANVTNAATAALTTPASIKWAWVGNNNSTVCYLQVFDLATGSVTLGTTAPKYSFFLPALGGGNINLGGGIVFLNAITVAVTTTRAGSTACTSGSDVNLGF